MRKGSFIKTPRNDFLSKTDIDVCCVGKIETIIRPVRRNFVSRDEKFPKIQ
jgi:hypothetical protein